MSELSGFDPEHLRPAGDSAEQPPDHDIDLTICRGNGTDTAGFGNTGEAPIVSSDSRGRPNAVPEDQQHTGTPETPDEEDRKSIPPPGLDKPVIIADFTPKDDNGLDSQPRSENVGSNVGFSENSSSVGSNATPDRGGEELNVTHEVNDDGTLGMRVSWSSVNTGDAGTLAEAEQAAILDTLREMNEAAALRDSLEYLLGSKVYDAFDSDKLLADSITEGEAECQRLADSGQPIPAVLTESLRSLRLTQLTRSNHVTGQRFEDRPINDLIATQDTLNANPLLGIKDEMTPKVLAYLRDKHEAQTVGEALAAVRDRKVSREVIAWWIDEGAVDTELLAIAMVTAYPDLADNLHAKQEQRLEEARQAIQDQTKRLLGDDFVGEG